MTKEKQKIKSAPKKQRGSLSLVKGQVISDKADKTISVQVYRLMKHAKYKKYIRRKSVFKTHDEKNSAKTGDMVAIYKTRPYSKTKRWRLFKILSAADKTTDKAAAKELS